MPDWSGNQEGSWHSYQGIHNFRACSYHMQLCSPWWKNVAGNICYWLMWTEPQKSHWKALWLNFDATAKLNRLHLVWTGPYGELCKAHYLLSAPPLAKKAIKLSVTQNLFLLCHLFYHAQLLQLHSSNRKLVQLLSWELMKWTNLII